jgi:hypothetical protein
MRRMLMVGALVLAALSAAGASVSAGSGQARWMITDLGTLGMKGALHVLSALQERRPVQRFESLTCLCAGISRVGRAGIEPATLGLKVPCSTN